MCKPGNGTIYAECRDAIYRENGSRFISQKEMRVLLGKHGSCMFPAHVHESLPIEVLTREPVPS